MPYDRNSGLWPPTDEHFFREREITPIRQSGPHCVSTVLGMLTGAEAERFQGKVNTQDPVSWSKSLSKWNMKLAYCPSDVRKVKYYLSELLAIDDLFTISYFTPYQSSDILADPSEDGWICGSHIVILHRDRIIDPASGEACGFHEHDCLECHTKRLFRVVPLDHERGL